MTSIFTLNNVATMLRYTAELESTLIFYSFFNTKWHPSVVMGRGGEVYFHYKSKEK
jgi:hypothetical protein